MAFKRRRSRSGVARRRADWVYRGWEQDSELSPFLDHMSYGDIQWTCLAGAQVAFVLYDSRNYLMQSSSAGNPLGAMPQAARAESGRRPQTWRVQGQLFFEPTTWTAGTIMDHGYRIGVFKQEPFTGDVLTPTADYGMFTVAGGGNVQIQPAVWANTRRNNLWERRHRERFATTNDTTNRTLNINVPARAALDQDECLAMLVEVHTIGTNIRGFHWLRTLVSDDG